MANNEDFIEKLSQNSEKKFEKVRNHPLFSEIYETQRSVMIDMASKFKL